MSNEDGRRDGSIFPIIGGSRSGKSAICVQRAKNDRRIVAWDAQSKLYRDFKRAGVVGLVIVRTIPELSRVLREAKGGSVKIMFQPVNYLNKKLFLEFCKYAYAAIVEAETTCILEEIGVFGVSGSAEGAFGQIIGGSLKYGPMLYIICQRPQESPKSIYDNADDRGEVICCNIAPRSRDYVYTLMEIEFNDWDRLKNHRSGDWWVIPYISKAQGEMRIRAQKIPFIENAN